jgi:hypothetical protein
MVINYVKSPVLKNRRGLLFIKSGDGNLPISNPGGKISQVSAFYYPGLLN